MSARANKISRLSAVLDKEARRIVGLMSGMSMDGVDLACIDISGVFPALKVDLVGTHYRPYPREFAAALRNARHGSTRDVSVLNVLVAQQFAACVAEFLARGVVAKETIDAVASHGQTLFHDTSGAAACASTLQIGAPSILAEMTGLLTIGNFRVRDIAAGGQGAPLVALADFVLFREPQRTVACNNLGSISNVTVVTPDLERVFAFDTGPANMAIDHFARLIPGNEAGIDADGRHSAQGHCIAPLLSALLANPFFSRPPPKAAGYDEFGATQLEAIARPFLAQPPRDLVRTAVDFAAITLADAYRNFVLPQHRDLERVVLSGGGVRNATLVARIREQLPGLTIELMPPELSAAKEAMAFAILGNETLAGRGGNIPAVTGAHAGVPLGEIAL